MDFRREHPHLDVIVIDDGLSANVPHIKILRSLQLNFILSVKPGDHTHLFESIDNQAEHGESQWFEETVNNVTHRYQFINKVPLTAGDDTIYINFLRYWENGKDGKVREFSWVTDYNLSPGNVE